jgi:hypothetical protein
MAPPSQELEPPTNPGRFMALVALPLIFLLRRAKAHPGETAILE